MSSHCTRKPTRQAERATLTHSQAPGPSNALELEPVQPHPQIRFGPALLLHVEPFTAARRRQRRRTPQRRAFNQHSAEVIGDPDLARLHVRLYSACAQYGASSDDSRCLGADAWLQVYLSVVQGYPQARLARGLIHVVHDVPRCLREKHRVFVNDQDRIPGPDFRKDGSQGPVLYGFNACRTGISAPACISSPKPYTSPLSTQ